MGNLKAAALVAALLSGTRRRLSAVPVLAVVWLAPVVSLQAAAPVVSAEAEQHQQQQTVVVQEQQTQNRNQVIADLQIQITALQEEIRLLNGKLEEQDYKISQMLERQRELYRDIDRRLSGAGTASTEPGSINTVPSAPESTVGPAAAAAVVVTEPTKPATKPSGKPSAKEIEAEQKAYDAIFPLVRNKQYSEAVKAYSDFLVKYPAGKNAANARYWLGQVYFVQGSNEDAEIQFKQVMSDYPDSPKAPDALLKLANIEERREATPAAKALYKQVVQKYPDSSSAAAAQKRLQELR